MFSMKSENIFLTGATGVLGAHLLKELLETTDSKIHCLVRAEDKSLGKMRVLTCIKAYDPNLILKDSFEDRVEVVIGDVVQPNFGLNERDYQELVEKIDLTFHVAAFTNLFVNFRRIAPINIGGTEHCIKFALATKQKFLSYISTHTVMGNSAFDRSLIFKETDLDIGQGFEHMTYQKSKFIAENLVREATAQGLKWNIIRPGQIFGDSRTGFYPRGQTNVSGLFYDIFKTVTETGIALLSNCHFDVVPVDYVSRGTIALALRNEDLYQTYHLTNPDILRYSEVVNLLEEQGYDIKHVPQATYKEILFSNALKIKGTEYKSSTVSAFKWWFKKDIFNFEDGCITDCTFTANKLSNYGIRCHRLDADLIGRYIEECVKDGYMPKVLKPQILRTEKVQAIEEVSI
jgi:thioester reductase-like protein